MDKGARTWRRTSHLRVAPNPAGGVAHSTSCRFLARKILVPWADGPALDYSARDERISGDELFGLESREDRQRVAVGPGGGTASVPGAGLTKGEEFRAHPDRRIGLLADVTLVT